MKKLLTVLLIISVSLFSAAVFSACESNNDTPPSRADLIQTVRYGVVEVDCGNQGGSGVVIRTDTASTVVLTNRHVLRGVPYVPQVRFGGENDFRPAVIRGFTAAYDIAVLEILHHPPLLPPANIHVFETNRMPVHGGDVLALGFGSFANQNRRILNTFDGIISAPEVFAGDRINSPDVFAIQSTTGFLQGSSGGALVDTHGRLLGLTSWGYDIGGDPISNIGYSIPIAIATAVADRILASASPSPFTLALGFGITAQGTVDIHQPAWNGYYITSLPSGIYQVRMADNSMRRITAVNGITIGGNMTVLLAEIIRTQDDTAFNFA